MIGIEPAEGSLEDVAVGDSRRRVVDAGGPDGREVDLDGATASASRDVETRVDRESPEPGVEPARVAQPGQVPPGANACFLDRVARELVVPEDQPGNRFQSR